MKSRTLATLLLSTAFGGLLYVASHFVADQTVSAASFAVAQQIGGNEGVIQTPHPQTGAAQTTPIPQPETAQQAPTQPGHVVIRHLAPGQANVHPPVAQAPASNRRGCSHIGSDARAQILGRHSQQIKRDGLCKRLEQRRAALRQEQATTGGKK